MAHNSAFVEEPITKEQSEKSKYKLKILWINVMYFLFLHASFCYALYLVFTRANWKTSLFAYIYGSLGNMGVSVGMHRLWTHRAFKAKWPLRVLLCCFASIAGQNDIYKWCREHRVHHKFAETDADPHNITRGFFFAHIGWLLCKKHPDVVKKGKTVALDDVWADPIVRFQKRLYIPMFLFFCFALPTMIPVWCWGESKWNSFFISGLAKYVFFLNIAWMLNSVTHVYGNRPYDTKTTSTDNDWAIVLSQGEGWHNYHHVFPWDYSSSELGYLFNITKLFIDCMAMIGQAYDRKLAHPGMIKSRKIKTGEGANMKKIDKKEKNFFRAES